MIFPVLILSSISSMPVVITSHAIVSPESTKRKERGGIMFGFGVSKPLTVGIWKWNYVWTEEWLGPCLFSSILSTSVCKVFSHAIVSPENTKKRERWHSIRVGRTKNLWTTGFRKLNSPPPKNDFPCAYFFLDFVNACKNIAIVSPENTKRKEWGGIIFGFGVSKAFELLGSEDQIVLDLKND